MQQSAPAYPGLELDVSRSRSGFSGAVPRWEIQCKESKQPSTVRKPGCIWDATEGSFGDPGPDFPLPVPKQGTFILSSQVQYFSSTNKLPRPGGAQEGDVEDYGGEVKSAEDLAPCQPWSTLADSLEPPKCLYGAYLGQPGFQQPR